MKPKQSDATIEDLCLENKNRLEIQRKFLKANQLAVQFFEVDIPENPGENACSCRKPLYKED